MVFIFFFIAITSAHYGWLWMWGKVADIFISVSVYDDCAPITLIIALHLIYIYVARYQAQLTRANKSKKKKKNQLQASNQNTLLAAVLYRRTIESGIRTINFLIIINYFGWKWQRFVTNVTISTRSHRRFELTT